MIFLKATYVLHRKNRHAFTGKKKEMALVEVGHVSIVLGWASLSSKENRREGVIQRLAKIF